MNRLPKIVFITNITRQAGMMQKSLENLTDLPGFPTGRVLMAGKEESKSVQGQDWLDLAAVTVVSWMGDATGQRWLTNLLQRLRQQRSAYIFLGQGDVGEPYAGKATEDEYRRASRYLNCSGEANFHNLWLWLATKFCGFAEAGEAPAELPWCGIVHPIDHQAILSLEEYRRQGFLPPDRPVIGLLIPRDEWIWDDLAHQQALMDALKRQNLSVIPVFSHWAADPAQHSTGVDTAVESFFRDKNGWLIDVLINTLKFSLTVGRPVNADFLQTIDRPVLQAYSLLQPAVQWRESLEGLSPLDVSFSLALPEFDGVIHSAPFAGREGTDPTEVHHAPIVDRLDLLARKAEKWARLRRLPNGEKKVAIIFHNYPPSNASIGNAAGLDSAASVWELLRQMKLAGYGVEDLPDSPQHLMEKLIASGTNDRQWTDEEDLARYCGRVTGTQYRTWFASLPEQTAAQLRRDWGEPPGEIFRSGEGLAVCGMRLGHIYIGLQPPRGFGEDPAKIYHSPDCAPTHHYLAYYYWVREIFGAHAVIHVGTHGSLEWLPGKSSGLSSTCYPELALGDLPDIYPYLITIVGEGMQAKRRGAACLIGHQTPPMSDSGVYGELAELERLLDEYRDYGLNQPEKLPMAQKQVLEAARQANLERDVPPPAPDETFSAYIQRLHAYIGDIKNMQIRVGLHILGKAPAGDTLVEYMLAMTRLPNGDIPSLFAAVAGLRGYDYAQLQDRQGEMIAGTRRTYGAVLDEVRDECRRLVRLMADYRFHLQMVWPEIVSSVAWKKPKNESGWSALKTVTEYICGPLRTNLELTEQEMTNTLRALGGRFVEPGPAGAPTSGMADILPTGRNFYGVDPRTLPSPVAWECGKTLSELLIARYIEEEGRYPESVGMVLWSGANLRSRGQCIAQFLYLLGVRPVWQKSSGRVADLEIIPLAELKRPRIDVTARISGLFRDAMPFAVSLMDRATTVVAALDESWEENYVRKHVQQEAQELMSGGMEARRAFEQAGFRIFGCPPGSYGAGVGALLEAQNWENVDDLGQVYVRWGGYAYGAKVRGEFLPERFSRRLTGLDVTIKNEDNREVNLLHSDDFNAYHGGMVAAVRSLKGRAPRSYCGDSSDRGRVAVRSLQEEFCRVFRAEAMNPKFIEGMKNHGYKGAADLAAVAAHCFDWDATSEVMEDWMYETLAEKYALDPAVRKWMSEVNPWALRRITEKLLEAAKRRMWDPQPETLDELRTLYLDIEGEMEERTE